MVSPPPAPKAKHIFIYPPAGLNCFKGVKGTVSVKKVSDKKATFFKVLVDPEWFIQDPDPALNSEFRIQIQAKFRIHANPDPAYIN